MLSAAYVFQGQAVAREIRARSARVASLISGDAGPSPLLSLAYLYPDTPKSLYLPFEAVKSKVVRKMADEYAQKLADASLTELKDYLNTHSRFKLGDREKTIASATALGMALAAGTNEATGFAVPLAYGSGFQLGNAPEYRRGTGMVLLGVSRTRIPLWAIIEQEQVVWARKIKAHVAETIQHYGMEQGTTETPRDRFEVDEDKGLAPLREAFTRDQLFNPPGSRSRKFASIFFDQGSFQGLYSPQQISPGDNRYLYWKTAEEAPYVPTFAEARPRSPGPLEVRKSPRWPRKQRRKSRSKRQGKRRSGKEPRGRQQTLRQTRAPGPRGSARWNRIGRHEPLQPGQDIQAV